MLDSKAKIICCHEVKKADENSLSVVVKGIIGFNRFND